MGYLIDSTDPESPQALTHVLNVPGLTSASYVVPALVGQAIDSVVVQVDATAAGDTTATLTVTDQTGAVIADKQQGQSIDAGVVGRATWALRLTDEARTDGLHWGTNTDTAGQGLTLDGFGGFQFNTNNNGFDTDTDGGGYSVHTGGGGLDLRTQGGGFTVYTDGGGQDFVTNDGGWTVNAGDGDASINTVGGVIELSTTDCDVLLNQTVKSIRIQATSEVQVISNKLGFFGVAPVVRPAHPVTLGDVIAALTALGLVAP